jgi:pyruvate,orthophosphate dikinase
VTSAAEGQPAAVLVALVSRALDPSDGLTPAAAVQAASIDDVVAVHHARLAEDDGGAGAEGGVLAVGIGASPGVASGVAVFDAWRALDLADEGEDVILVRPETSPADEPALSVAVGVLTARGGLTSHAAVVARGRGLPAVCGAATLTIGDDDMVDAHGTVVAEGERITIDGATGEVRVGARSVAAAEVPDEVQVLLGWADDARRGRLGVLANADTPDDAARALALGAEGIGLCRTEHQFLGARLPLLQRVILDPADAEALAELESAQRADFAALLGVMDGRPVVVRLLDAPLHEFLPDLVELSVDEAAGRLDPDGAARLAAARRWREHNPMLGVRGVRLAVRRPELARLQLRALLSAAAELRRSGGDPRPRVMVPMVSLPSELQLVRGWVDEVRRELDSPAVPVGAMVETPRAAWLAGPLAEAADYLSIGTNDLTQLVYGFSRDDVGPLLVSYVELGLLPADPFATFDDEGVAGLVAHAITAARASHPGIKVSVCGEHAGDPASIGRLVALGVDALSCSPARLAVARLAAAQAVTG